MVASLLATVYLEKAEVKPSASFCSAPLVSACSGISMTPVVLKEPMGSSAFCRRVKCIGSADDSSIMHFDGVMGCMVHHVHDT